MRMEGVPRAVLKRVQELGRVIESNSLPYRRPWILIALGGICDTACANHLSPNRQICGTADLARSITPVPDGLHLDFIRASSYHGTSTSTSGVVEVSGTQKIPVKGRHVLLVRNLFSLLPCLLGA